MDAGRAPLKALRVAAYGLPIAFIALFFLYPFAALIERGLSQDGALSVPWDVFGSSGTAELLWFTLWQAVVSTVLTVVVALPCAYVFARYSFPGRHVGRAAMTVPFVLPTIVVATAFLALLPDSLDHTIWAILLAHAFFNFAVVTRTVGSYWSQIDPRLGDAAAALGAGSLGRFRHVTLPLLAPALAAASSIVFLFSFSSFGIILMLGGTRYSTLETEIYNQAARVFDLRTAAALALLQLLVVAAVVAVTTWLERRLVVQRSLLSGREGSRSPRGTREWLEVCGALILMGVLLAAPLALLIERSFSTSTGYGLTHYRSLGHETESFLASPLDAVVTSIEFALAATVIAVVIGGLAAFAVGRRRSSRSSSRAGLDVLLMLPLGTSAVMLGFGFVIAFDEPPFDFRSSIWLVPVAQALVAIPFVVRIVAPVLASIDERLREAAAVLGASPAQTWRVIDLPLVLRALAVAAGFGFAISLGEFGATVFIARADHPTMPVMIYRFLGRPGEANAGTAMALCVLLMLVTVAAVLVSERGREQRHGVL